MISLLLLSAVPTGLVDTQALPTVKKPYSYPYASIQLGVGFPKNYTGDFEVDGVDDVLTELDFNTGISGELALGYKFNNIRTDLSIGYGSFGVNEQLYRSADYGSASVSGRGSAGMTTVMLNGYYDIPIYNGDRSVSRWSPYVGGGVGYANISTPACAAADCFQGGSAGAFAWQAKAGMSYRATERGFAFMEGGYVGTAGNTTVDAVTFGNFGGWRITLGWRQGFGGSDKPQAVLKSETAPAAMPVITPESSTSPQVHPPIRGLW